MNSDEKALKLLQKAVIKAQSSLEKSLTFRPFLLTMDSDGTIKTIENREPTDQTSYSSLEESIEERARESKLEVIVLAMKDTLPHKFSDNKTQISIRLHIEERSQLSKTVSARFLYIPYTLHSRVGDDQVDVQWGEPHPVGFPAEYLK